MPESFVACPRCGTLCAVTMGETPGIPQGMAICVAPPPDQVEERKAWEAKHPEQHTAYA